MKKIITEEQNEGMESLLGEIITVFCCRYIYTGKLTGIDNDCILLENPSIVYETGEFDNKEWGDVQKLPQDKWYIQKASIESFGIMK
jgi:hypothetical protein